MPSKEKELKHNQRTPDERVEKGCNEKISTIHQHYYAKRLRNCATKNVSLGGSETAIRRDTYTLARGMVRIHVNKRATVYHLEKAAWNHRVISLCIILCALFLAQTGCTLFPVVIRLRISIL